MRVFVTGGTGHIGSAVVRELVRAEHAVAVLLRPTSQPSALSGVLSQLTVIEGDLRNVQSLTPALRQFAPDVTVHLAWFGVTNNLQNDPRQISENLTGSLDLIELSAAAGARTFVGLGSQAEYGRVDGVLTEDLPLRPLTTYGTVKTAVGLVGERLAVALGLRFVWLRLLATYGPFDDPRHLIPFVIDQYLTGRIPELTPGEQVWDYLYVDDAVRALMSVVQSQQASGVYNLASGTGRSVASIVTQIRDLVNPALPLGLGLRAYAENQIMHLRGDISRLTASTGWKPTTSFAAGLDETLVWHRNRLSVQIQHGEDQPLASQGAFHDPTS